MKPRQHTVPAFYLRHFAIPGQQRIVCCDRRSGRIKSQSIRDTAVSKHIYTLRNNRDPMALEDAFCELEQEASSGFRRLLAGHSLDKQIKSRLAPFMAAQLKRTMWVHKQHIQFIAEANKPENIVAYVSRLRKILESRFGSQEVDAFVQQTMDGKTRFDFDQAEMLRRAQRKLRDYCEALMDMHWRLEVSPRSEFITSDNPVYIRRKGRPMDPGLVGLERADLNAELHFPLSPQLFLLLSWNQERIWRRKVSYLRARELNRLTILCSDRQIYGPSISRSLQQLVAEHRGFELKLFVDAAQL